MTVLTMPAQPAQDAVARPVPWRMMAWVTWRLHRPTLISVPVLLGAVAVFLWIAGLKVHRDYAALTACHPFASDACQALNSSFNKTDWPMGNAIDILLQLVPPLIGAFAGAPVLARELETGTFRYAWTQVFGRERQTIARLVLLAVVVTAATGAFSQVFTWFCSSSRPAGCSRCRCCSPSQLSGWSAAAPPDRAAARLRGDRDRGLRVR